ncbi:MAG: class I SAM-dependent methyltransferase [Phycisphaerae bacterium]|nr:class I SAM-dependent methyltransferase [Saprospiraceae bacterium]
MELKNAIELIQNPHLLQQNQAVWADLGCGSGLFTAALAHLLNTGSTVFAVDKNLVELNIALFPQDIEIRPMQLDFVEESLPFHQLDGILMANSLHFVRDKMALINKLSASMKSEGHFLIVEYDTDKPVQQWVPYPISFDSLQQLFIQAGYSSVVKLGERPSLYSRAKLYAALIPKLTNSILDEHQSQTKAELSS